MNEPPIVDRAVVIGELMDEVARLEKALQAVEWSTCSETIAELPHCPACLNCEDEHHESDCILWLALQGLDVPEPIPEPRIPTAWKPKLD